MDAVPAFLGEHDELAAFIAGVRATRDVASLFEEVDHLACGLLCDAKVFGEFVAGGSVGGEKLEGEAVGGSDVGIAGVGEFRMQVVDQDAPGCGEEGDEFIGVGLGVGLRYICRVQLVRYIGDFIIFMIFSQDSTLLSFPSVCTPTA